MATLREIKHRIKSIKSTQQITKAMKMVAAAKMRRAQERMFSARPYAFKIRDLIHHILRSVENPQSPLLQERPVRKVSLVVITADRGLCGAFNGNVFKRVLAEFDQHKEKEHTLVCIGRKGHEFFKKRGYDISFSKVNIFNELDFQHASEIGNFLIDEFISGRTDSVKLIFNEFKSVAQQLLVSEVLLPLEVAAEEESKPVDYLYEPSEIHLLTSLLPRYFKVQIWRALLESYASEQAARMLAMENATDNATELIDSLTLKYNKARQASITKEILEIVGGAEALKSAS